MTTPQNETLVFDDVEIELHRMVDRDAVEVLATRYLGHAVYWRQPKTCWWFLKVYSPIHGWRTCSSPCWPSEEAVRLDACRWVLYQDEKIFQGYRTQLRRDLDSL